MAVNQAQILEQLELLVGSIDPNEFIFSFMTAFEFPKATLTQVRQGGARNVAKEPGHVGIKNKLYYQPFFANEENEKIEAAFEARISDPLIKKNKIRFLLCSNFTRFLAWDTLTQERLDIEFNVMNNGHPL